MNIKGMEIWLHFKAGFQRTAAIYNQFLTKWMCKWMNCSHLYVLQLYRYIQQSSYLLEEGPLS